MGFFVIGILEYVLPSTSLLRRAGGSLLFVCGVFLMTNSDLVVSFLRMRQQVGRMQDMNEHFEECLDKQGDEVRKLTNAKRAFDELNLRFGGQLIAASSEVERLSV